MPAVRMAAPSTIAAKTLFRSITNMRPLSEGPVKSDELSARRSNVEQMGLRPFQTHEQTPIMDPNPLAIDLDEKRLDEVSSKRAVPELRQHPINCDSRGLLRAKKQIPKLLKTLK